MRLVEVGGMQMEVHDVGTGDPVVLVQTALIADEFVPLADHLVRTASSSTTGAATPGAARFRDPGQWFAMPPLAGISSWPWG
jgi:hypothetical protein